MSSLFFGVTALATTLLCALVAGLVLGFAVVVMPGIASLPDRDFLKAFKVMDAVIQNQQPLFIAVWVGSTVAMLVLLVLGTLQRSGTDLHLVWLAGGLYLLGVQGPTVRFNIPLNNALQALDVESMSETEAREVRLWFEASWNRWNRFRTVAATAALAVLLGVLWRG